MTTAAPRPWRRALSFRDAGVYYALLALLATFTVIAAATGRPFYLDGRNMANLIEQASMVGILAIFMTIVLITGNFDLSVAAVAALSAAAAVIVLQHVGIVGAILVAMAVGAAIGLLNGVLVEFVGINAFIVTLGTLTAIRGLFLALTNGQSVRSEDGELVNQFREFVMARVAFANAPLVLAIVFAALLLVRLLLRWRRPGTLRRGIDIALIALIAIAGLLALLAPFPIELAAGAWYFVLLVPIAAFVLGRTVLGRRLYAVGGNPQAAKLVGVAATRYKLLAFVASGTAAGLVGALFAARTGTVTPSAMSGLELTVIAACVLGGVSLFGGSGSILKSIAGVFILYALSNGFNMLNIGANYQQLIQGVIIVASAAVYTIADRRVLGLLRRRGRSAAPVMVIDAQQADAARPESSSTTREGE